MYGSLKCSLKLWTKYHYVVAQIVIPSNLVDISYTYSQSNSYYTNSELDVVKMDLSKANR